MYARSAFLPTLVSSRVDQQLEFLAVGSWFVYSSGGEHNRLFRIPNSREDILADPSLDLRAKRGLVKFLKFVGSYEEQTETWEDFEKQPFHHFLAARFNLPESVLVPIRALVTSTLDPDEITTAFALPRVARHLRSIGLFGPGFGAVIPKWGGLAEIAQVGCRAGAVGGGVYVLGNGLKAISRSEVEPEHETDLRTDVHLANGEKVKTRFVVSSPGNLPSDTPSTARHFESGDEDKYVNSRAIHVVSSPLHTLFPTIAEGGPPPAVAMVALPASAIDENEPSSPSGLIYIMVHSSDTGECPKGQSTSPLFQLHCQDLLQMMINSYEYITYIVCNFLADKTTSDKLMQYPQTLFTACSLMKALTNASNRRALQ